MLEAKMFIFYSWEEENVENTISKFHSIVRWLIKTEKHLASNISSSTTACGFFYQKWEKFGEVYQIFGPYDYEI